MSTFETVCSSLWLNVSFSGGFTRGCPQKVEKTSHDIDGFPRNDLKKNGFAEAVPKKSKKHRAIWRPGPTKGPKPRTIGSKMDKCWNKALNLHARVPRGLPKPFEPQALKRGLSFSCVILRCVFDSLSFSCVVLRRVFDSLSFSRVISRRPEVSFYDAFSTHCRSEASLHDVRKCNFTTCFCHFLAQVYYCTTFTSVIL